MIGYLGWIAAAFLAGVLLSGRVLRRRRDLTRRVARMGVFRGRGFAEIVKAMDAPQATTAIGDGRIVRSWWDDSYSISLLFDAAGMCQGVYNEGTGGYVDVSNL